MELGDKEYRRRRCWNCNSKLNFEDFHATNSQFSVEVAEFLWQNVNIEFYCCSCFKKQQRQQKNEYWEGRLEYYRELRENPPDKKVILVGIDNVGKTALVKVLYDRSSANAFNLLPTRFRDVQYFLLNNVKYIVWELAGVENYRNRWLEKIDIAISETSEMIYMIDVQDPSRYEDSIEYLSEFFDSISKEGTKDFVESDMKFFIFFHKADFNMLNNSDVKVNIDHLRNEIEQLELPIEHEMYITSIFSFEDNFSETLISNENEIGFGALMAKLFSPITC